MITEKYICRLIEVPESGTDAKEIKNLPCTDIDSLYWAGGKLWLIESQYHEDTPNYCIYSMDPDTYAFSKEVDLSDIMKSYGLTDNPYFTDSAIYFILDSKKQLPDALGL